MTYVPKPYEDSAEVRTVTGWCCKRCNRFWGDDKHMAHHCCSDDFPCRTEGCEGRANRGYVSCDACREAVKIATWDKHEKHPYDGGPVVEYDGDRYYFDDGSLHDDILEWLADGCTVESLRFVMCGPEPPPEFAINEFLCDHLPEDMDVDGKEIDKIVNDWIKANVPPVYFPDGRCVDPNTLPLPTPEELEEYRADTSA